MTGKKALKKRSESTAIAKISRTRASDFARTAKEPSLMMQRGAELALRASETALSSVADAAVAGQEKLKRMWDVAKDKNSRSHKATVDMSGSIVGVLSFEGLNYVVRYMGEKFAAIGGSVDYWQSIPHLVLGLVAYWGELLTRKKPGKDGAPLWPSMPREIASEWAKVFILLGASNLFRALRVRRKDAKIAAEQLTQIQAELAKTKEELRKYETPAPK